MGDKFKCPRCGVEQPETEVCKKCRINIPRYLELQKRRRAVPGDYVRKPRARDDKQPAEGPAPEKRHYHSEKAGEAQREANVPPEPSDPPETEIKLTERGIEGGFTSIGNLFEKTWDIFKRRIGTLIVLYLFTIGLVLLPVGFFLLIAYLISLALHGSFEVLMIVGGVIGATAGLIAGCWGFGSFFCAIVDENLGIKDALEKGGQNIWAFIWLFSILGYIIPGGFLLFFVPGILFMVWFAFAVFILPNEDEKGMDAVLKSKEYVKGHWVDVFVRLFVIWLVSIGVGMIPVIGSIVSIIAYPFIMIFIFLIYEDLRSIKGDVSGDFSAGEKLGWIGIATLGYLVVIVFTVAVMGAALMHSISIFKEALPY